MRGDTVVTTVDTIDFVSDTLAHRLQQVLTARGWTPYEWSQKAALSDATVANIISRGSGARMLTLEALASSAGVPFEWLARGTGSSGLEGAEGMPSTEHVEPKLPALGSNTTSRPTFSSLPGWMELIAGARSRAAERNRAIPEWAWDAMAATSPVLTEAPTVAAIYELVCLFADHGWGRPRDMKDAAHPSVRSSARKAPGAASSDARTGPKNDAPFPLDESGPSGVRSVEPAAEPIEPALPRKHG